MKTVYKALILSPKKDQTLKAYDPGFMAVSEKGLIEEVSKYDLRKKYKNYK